MTQQRREEGARRGVEGSVSVPFRVRYSKSEDGGYVAECLDLPGCMTQGETLFNCAMNIKDAIQAVLEVRIEGYAPAPSQGKDPE